MRYQILVVLEKAEHNYSAFAPDVDGCVATGATVDETLRNMQEALEMHLGAMSRDGDPMPEISSVEAHIVEVDVPHLASRVS